MTELQLQQQLIFSVQQISTALDGGVHVCTAAVVIHARSSAVSACLQYLSCLFLFTTCMTILIAKLKYLDVLQMCACSYDVV